MRKKTKTCIVLSSPFLKTKKRAERKWRCSGLGFMVFRERGSGFSLGFRSIGPSDFFGPRRKVVLRSEGFVWAPVLGSFNKLCEVGVLSYLVYS